MQVKVISDGTLAGTKVVDAQTGELVQGVRAIKWNMNVDSLTADVVMELVKIPVDIVGTVKEKEETKNEVLQK